MDKTDFEIKNINILIGKLHSIYLDIQYNQEIFEGHKTGDPEIDVDYQYEISEMESNFYFYAKQLIKSIQVYLEIHNLLKYLDSFNAEIEKSFESQKEMLEGTFSMENGELHSNFLEVITLYLKPFEVFSKKVKNENNKKKELRLLENTLKNTSVILKRQEKIPTSEAQVYNGVKLVIETVFTAPIFPSESFQKTAKCYKPDILLPHLGCAIEYKYAINETKLIETIDQILIDVKGYKNHPTYHKFYAVFYVKPGIWTKNKFKTVWKEKEFPTNWKGILVLGE